MDLSKESEWFRKRILERFLHAVRIDTTSDRHNEEIPSTSGQWLLAQELEKELGSLGLEEVSLDEHCYLYALLAPTKGGRKTRPFGLIAHLDTTSDAPGKNVIPRVHHHYDGKPIDLAGGISLDPAEFPQLLRYSGSTIITSDGTTLLGADDKAGIAEIITAIEYLSLHPEIEHGPIEVILTPDEESGRGMNRFPRKKLRSVFCLTLDGSGDGIIEAECFEAYSVTVSVKGKSIHLGEARGKLVNAVQIASTFIGMVPEAESPQATDNRYGYYAPIEVKGTIEEARIEFLIRDFEDGECRRRIEFLESLAQTFEKAHPGAVIETRVIKQYSNMKPFIEGKKSGIIGLLRQAVRNAGGEPSEKSIRGGTDGARLSEQGIPTPNLFSGGFNYHSRLEWASLEAMVRAAQSVVWFARLIHDEDSR